MNRWYALFTKPHKERQVETLLIQRGIRVYFPTVGSISRRSSEPRAFFPRYLFAQCDIEEIGLNSLQFTPGMTSVVMFGGIPASVSDGIIARLRERLGRIEAQSLHGDLIRSGDPVRVNAERFTHLEALFDRRLSESGRVRVLIRMLQRWTPVELDGNEIRKLGNSEARTLAVLA